MPKQTFFNLPLEKRQIIEQAALDEFSEYGFDSAVLNRIVAESKIAKGSFYQYFEDIKDLYFHLIDTLIKKKAKHIEPALKSYKEHSLPHNLKEIFRLGLEFSEDDPKLQKLGEDFVAKSRPFYEDFAEKYKPEAMDIYTILLVHAQENGELREDINLPLASFFISSLIDKTVVLIMGQRGTKEQTNSIVRELLSYIERAIMKEVSP